MFPTHTLDIVYCIGSDIKNTGTCFTFFNGKKYYLITAQHILNSFSTFEIETDLYWEKLTSYLKFINPDNSEIDIVAIEIDNKLANNLKFKNFNYFSQGIILGNDSFFFGYPFNLKNYMSFMIEEEIKE